jgi:predicted GNAT family acetyltransferase
MVEFFTNNTDKSRFEYDVDGKIVFASYRLKDDHLFIDYVEAPGALRGTGAAGKLMEQIMQIARQDNLKITPVCGYASSWLRRHSEYSDLLA